MYLRTSHAVCNLLGMGLLFHATGANPGNELAPPRERVRVDVYPSRAYAADICRLMGDRFGAVVNHK